MSKPNTKRSSISKLNSLTQSQIPENINNKFINESSTIVNDIIEKIISLVISSNFTHNIEKNLSLSCIEFVTNTLNSYLSTNFITHDKDEMGQNSFLNSKSGIIQEIEPISKKNEISILDSSNIINNTKITSNLNLDENFYFNNYYHGQNDWGLMDEPPSNKYDRYAATMITFRETEKQNQFKYNKNGQVLEEVDEESEKNSVINNKTKNEFSPNKKEIKKLKSLININNKNKKKNLIDIMNQFPYQDLDDNDDIYTEPKDINYEQLRKEAEEKQNEASKEKKVVKKAKIEVENKIKAEIEKNRQFIGKKITVDPKGEIVVIKGIKLDKLNKEFILLKTSTKLKKDEEKEKKIKKKKKNKKEKLNLNDFDRENFVKNDVFDPQKYQEKTFKHTKDVLENIKKNVSNYIFEEELKKNEQLQIMGEEINELKSKLVNQLEKMQMSQKHQMEKITFCLLNSGNGNMENIALHLFHSNKNSGMNTARGSEINSRRNSILKKNSALISKRNSTHNDSIKSIGSKEIPNKMAILQAVGEEPIPEVNEGEEEGKKNESKIKSMKSSKYK